MTDAISTPNTKKASPTVSHLDVTDTVIDFNLFNFSLLNITRASSPIFSRPTGPEWVVPRRILGTRAGFNLLSKSVIRYQSVLFEHSVVVKRPPKDSINQRNR